MSRALAVRTFVAGPIATNVYLVEDQASGEAIVVDPGGGVDELLAHVAERGLRVTAIVNTHGHFDHVSGNRALRDATGARLLLHRADAGIAARASGLASFVRQEAEDSPRPDGFLEEGDLVRAGGIELRVLHTPGHTPGGISLQGGGAVFCGDLIFAGGPGLTDLPGCSPELLLASIREKILRLPAGTTVYPGHGPPTSVRAERGKPCYGAPGSQAISGSRRSGRRA